MISKFLYQQGVKSGGPAGGTIRQSHQADCSGVYRELGWRQSTGVSEVDKKSGELATEMVFLYFSIGQICLTSHQELCLMGMTMRSDMILKSLELDPY